MSQIFDSDGRVIPVTVVSSLPLIVTSLKSKDKDGYYAIVFGYGTKKLEKMNKPLRGHLKKNLGEKAEGFKFIREWRVDDKPTIAVGARVDASILDKGESVTVSGISKGKGFAGNVKRHGFSGGPRTHGQKHSEREPGSIGVGGGVQRVFKGQRMAGRMGGDRITVKNLKVIDYDSKNHLLFLKGAIPGRRGTLIEVYNNK